MLKRVYGEGQSTEPTNPDLPESVAVKPACMCSYVVTLNEYMRQYLMAAMSCDVDVSGD